MTLSVMICTCNRHEVLARALDALINRTTEKPEQVVIVNGGDSRADEVVRSFQSSSRLEILLVKTVNRNLAASRNVGIPYCTGEILAMTDDDAEVFPDWVSQIKLAFQNHQEAGAVGGAVLGAQSSSSFVSRLSDQVTFVSPLTPRYVRTLPGVNVAYLRDIIKLLGPQDELLFRGEDVDFNWRVKRLGKEIYYDPSIRVIHHHRPNLKQFMLQHYMYGRAYYLVRSKWPEMYCIYPHHFRSFKSIVKAGFFAVSTVYDPIRFALRMSRISDRMMAVPVLLVNQCVWKWGMTREKVRSLQKRNAQ